MDAWSFLEGRWQPGDLEHAEARWFDVLGEADELTRLAARFALHPLSVEDCLSRLLHAPKIDEFADHLFVVLYAFVPSDSGPTPEELDVFLGNDFIITYQDSRVPATSVVAERLERGLNARPGVDGLFYEIADVLTDAILPQVNDLSEQLDYIQDAVLDHPDSEYNRRTLNLRSQAGRIRRLIIPQVAAFQRLSRGEFGHVHEANRIYFRDIFDHLTRIDIALETLREDAEVALNTYLSVLNNRMNEVMKVLSVVGALALPAVVIAGIFGTNFDNVPGLHSNWGFLTMMASMAGLAGSMAYYFRRRGWF
jgi:magnesium transporter